jgi:DNA polymerase-3 subunit epsilon/ATP-dependent DNA helicase DinG
MERVYVALDLEFTGLDVQRDDIIEIGMVRFQGQKVLETFSSLVNPNRSVPLKIQQLSGFDQAEISHAPPLRTLSGKVLAFVRNYPVVGHTVETDLQFLAHQGLPLNNLAIDTFELAGILMPEVTRYSLGNLAQVLGIDLPQQHRALADATATKDLFLALVERANTWDLGALEEIVRLSENSDWPLRQVFRDLLSERREREPAPLLSRWRAPRGDALYAARPTEDDLPPLKPSETVTPVDSAPLAAMISPGGVFERAFPGYEHRPQQVQMLEAVAEAFNAPLHLLVEAGTGTGKSLAYLLPAAHFALQNGRRIVISSNTINLQDQLYKKDLPDLQRILNLPIHVALLKGRSNYLCLRRLAAFRRSRQLNREEVRLLAKVLAWLPVTTSGDRSELIMVNADFQTWTQFQASSETCLGDRCPYRQSDQCFFYRARARAERSHLVIVNHALLLSDLALESRILPEYKYVIVDEAHHLEEQATEQFGVNVGKQDVYAFLVGLSHEGSDVPGGLLAELPKLLSREGLSSSAQQTITTLVQTLRTEVDTAQRRLAELFNTLEMFLRNHSTMRGEGDLYDQDIPLTTGLRTQPDWLTVEIAWESLAAPLQQLLRSLERLAAYVEALPLGEDAERDEMAQEVKAQLQLGSEMTAALDKILMTPEAEGIYWISIARRDQEIALHSAPLHIGPLLQERLFAGKEAVVLTSATLRTEGSFHFIESRLGLETPEELALDSPFNYAASVLLYVPKDMPEPNQPGYQKAVESAIIELCKATEGRALVLFTSNSQLNNTYRAVQGPLEREGIVVFGQGLDGSRNQLLERFRNSSKAVLMGTRSFWEGIDVVGQALSCLVIARLPFAVPSDPVFAARSATFSDPFNEYSLPDSILRFRQGFGRLIRSKNDYGLVVVLDKRILTKSYGKTILHSLPPCTARQGPLQALPELARRWLDPDHRK